MPDDPKIPPSLLLGLPSFHYRLPEMPIPVPVANPLMDAAHANYASEFHKRLVSMINRFNAGLAADYEVGVRLVSFGQTIVFHLEDLGYWNPSLISFTGKTEQGEPVELVQHVSQISILLMKLPRKDPSRPKRVIGFAPPADAEKDGGPSE